MKRVSKYTCLTAWILWLFIGALYSSVCPELNGQNGSTAADLVKTLNEKLSSAKAASDAGDFNTAVRILTEATQLDPSRAVLWANLGVAYGGLAHSEPIPEQGLIYRKAADTLGKAAALKPDDFSIRENHAVMLGRAGDILGARAETEQAALLDPAHAPMCFYNLAVVALKSGHMRMALEAAQKVPDSAEKSSSAKWIVSVSTVGIFLDSASNGFHALRGAVVATDADVRKVAAQINQPTGNIGHFVTWNSTLSVPGGQACVITDQTGSKTKLECGFNRAATPAELKRSYDSLISMVTDALGSNASSWESKETEQPGGNGLKHVFTGPSGEVDVEVYDATFGVKGMTQLPYELSLTVISTQEGSVAITRSRSRK